MKGRKGVSLPIEVIVILVIAVIVLVAIVAFFTTSIKKGEASFEDQERWQKACNALKMNDCDVNAMENIVIEGKLMTGTGGLCDIIAGAANDISACCRACCGTDSNCGDSGSDVTETTTTIEGPPIATWPGG